MPKGCSGGPLTARSSNTAALGAIIANAVPMRFLPDSTELRDAAHQAMLENGFTPEFSAEVHREVSALRDPTRSPSHSVRDMRALLWSSIDNRESKDLDQIEVAERLNNGAIRVLIAIADVDVLVPKGSATDDHARENTTSVYTGVAVFPMLPDRLSTNLTSLNEGEDRFAVVIEMDVAESGEVAASNVYVALVHNHAKLVYETVGAWLDGSAPIPPEIPRKPGLEEQVRLHDEAAQRLLALRRRNGALDLETIEASPVVVKGNVIDLKVTQRNRARDIIENFMVGANSAMARFLEANKVPSIRRVVRVPKKWPRIVQLAAEIGETLPTEPDRVALSEFLVKRKLADPEHFADLSLSVVKLLGPGEYMLERRLDGRAGEGHFGLAAAEYTHATAPNRRFPDLVTQRLMKSTDTDVPPYTEEELVEIARHCTLREDAARKVERSVRKKAAAALMRDRVGQSFPAMVTGASQKGIYVRLLSPPVEGRIVRGGEKLDVGDTVRVTLVRVDDRKGFIDFEHESAGVERKLDRSRRKKAAATALLHRIGQMFDATVTAVTDKGTWARTSEGIEGRIMRGHRGLAAGQTVQLKLIAADSVHGFIDFEYPTVVEPRKAERSETKKAAASRLQHRGGEVFEAVVSGVNAKATYVRTTEPEQVDGRLVRGFAGLTAGSRITVVLLQADPAKGYIDFARID